MKRTAGVLFGLLVLALGQTVPRTVRPLTVFASLAAGAALLLLGLAMARRLGHRPPVRARRLAAALGLGAAMGALLLLALRALVAVEPALAARLAARAGASLWLPLALATSASVLEEITFRLFLFTLVVWLWSRAWRRRPEGIEGAPAVSGFSVATANGIAALAFAAVHLPGWSQVVTPTALLVASVLALNGAAGLFLGAVYWRWGIEAAIAAHFAGDLVVQGVGPRLLS